MNDIEIIFKNRRKKIKVTSKDIILTPNPIDDPWIFYIWHKDLPPAVTATHSNVIFINLFSLTGIEEKVLKWLGNYLSSVLLEELTHLCTDDLTNHDNWLDILLKLQEELSNE